MSTESKGKQRDISSLSERKTDRQSPPDKNNSPLIRGARGVIYPTTYNGPIECQLLKYEQTRQSPSPDNSPLIRGARGVIYPTTYNGIECQLLKYELF